MRTFLCFVAVSIISASANAQQPSCVSPEEVARQRSRVEFELADYQNAAKELHNMYDEYNESLKVLAKCQKERTLLDDLTKTLTLQNAECRAESETSETLKARVKSFAELLQSKRTVLNLLAASYKASAALKCPE